MVCVLRSVLSWGSYSIYSSGTFLIPLCLLALMLYTDDDGDVVDDPYRVSSLAW